MKKFITQNGNYCIYEVGVEYLYDVAEFIVKENYKHHKGYYDLTDIEDEIDSVYQEELFFRNTSRIYIAENQNHQMVGCIRVMKWDKTNILPIQKIFNINPLNYINSTQDSSYWHVGRFAVNSCAGISNLSLFKQLMIYAIYPIYQEKDGYMIAECDSKLLRVMNLLGINTVWLSNGIHYLGSETIPVYADKKGLNRFYDAYYHLYSSKEKETLSYQQLQAV
jgi:hypothetical protein